jgi:hypothetical protein
MNVLLLKWVRFLPKIRLVDYCDLICFKSKFFFFFTKGLHSSVSFLIPLSLPDYCCCLSAMAKSIRSKSKRHFRALKRKDIFGKAEAQRLERLAAKQAEIKEADYVAEERERRKAEMEVDAGKGREKSDNEAASSKTGKYVRESLADPPALPFDHCN